MFGRAGTNLSKHIVAFWLVWNQFVCPVISSVPATYLPYLHKIAEASADFLLGGTVIPLGTHTRFRSLRTETQNESGMLNRTVLVSYRYPEKSIIAETAANAPSWLSGSEPHAPYRLLQAIQDQYNISRPLLTLNTDDVHDRAANVVTRNLVLARLYHKLVNPTSSLLIGLQMSSLPFDCAYLPGLHMEVLSASGTHSAQSMRETLLKDPFVEDVWIDEILVGEMVENQESATDKTLFGAARARVAAAEKVHSVLASLPNVVAKSDSDIETEVLFEPQLKGVSASPNDTHYADQWGHHHPRVGINAPRVWQEWTAEGTEFTIALVDSGVDLEHFDLRTQFWRNWGESDCFDGIDNDGNGYIDDCVGWDWIDNDNIPQDENGHGTASAGIIAAVANNGMGVAGVCWGCRLMVLRTLDKDIRGTISGFIKAIDYAVVQGVKVSNNSYGGRGSSFASLKTAVRRARKQGMIFVAAAGNYGSNNDLTGLQPTYPASYNDSNVVAVAAIDEEGNLAPFSCYGKRSVDIAAPGVKIISTGLGNRYTYMDGTSFATPFVSAAAALLWSWQPELSADEVIERLLANVRKLPSLSTRIASGGTLDLHGAMFQQSYPHENWQHERPGLHYGEFTKRVMDLQEENCDDIDICPHNSECVDTTRGLRCRCILGYRHIKGKCISDNQCSPTDPTRQCRSTEICEVSGSGFKCVCRPGFAKEKGQGDCHDIDECALDTFICPREATCLNTQGSFDCQCPLGSKWNGLAWIQKGASCEIDRKPGVARKGSNRGEVQFSGQG
eukprot:Gregarina_sp_Poly_1__419@NODE_1100_length_5098_cov_146_374081_g762_i0_p1_GENE_NODE_1100_length_5098_cov_146_374081_g762_i0NODE_1100_length_5098_cov_146_374081_g762_i0_p1_ORF_typecomplete_len786_score54_91Peptidase_S8/PF00082_22/2_4e66EGF_CA/PF07645_15/0_014EGF_CA/PF07645_15/0_14EGF_CA/PF07645_15/3_1e12EGF_MSP1_1/PF12946_7/2_7e06EGF_MSP1_1/PF12946_7/8_4EGF_MSP1_1/PF12946_7/0_024EGF_3/PF12947_7/0_36EGF_3/PF12947_7/42EGF_3/PF12947_7/2e03EGF_3/PF12947_7/2_8e05EGF/PF00008_27/0_085EGF/PF00008_27/0_22E